jgi:hypothetical protein
MLHTIAAVALPQPSLIQGALVPIDYVDAFSVEVPAGTFDDVDTLARACTSLPRWVDRLMWLRNRVVSRFGLQVSHADVPRDHGGTIRPGTAVGIFLVLARSDDELLMGLDDKHLDFRFSLLMESSGQRERAIATTTVKFNNTWGRLYFTFVKPFHRLIIPALLRAAIESRTRSRRAELTSGTP